jgi:hypothetical protein
MPIEMSKAIIFSLSQSVREYLISCGIFETVDTVIEHKKALLAESDKEQERKDFNERLWRRSDCRGSSFE